MKENTSIDYFHLFRSYPQSTLIISPQMDILEVSDSYLKVTLTEREKIIGKNLFTVFPRSMMNEYNGPSILKASIERVLHTKTTDQMDIIRYDIPIWNDEGNFQVRYWSAVNHPVLSSDNKVLYIIHVTEDVTETERLKQMMKESEISKQRFHQIAHMMPRLYGPPDPMASLIGSMIGGTSTLVSIMKENGMMMTLLFIRMILKRQKNVGVNLYYQDRVTK